MKNEKMKSDKAITLIALSITIIVLIILAGVAFSTGRDTLESSKLTAFTTEMKLMQIRCK